MRIQKQNVLNGVNHIVDFNSLYEFYKYITTTETNKAWSNAERLLKEKYGENEFIKQLTPLYSQRIANNDWYGTKTYEEAIELFKNGIPDESAKLTKLLKAEQKMQPVQIMKKVNNIQGFQPIVPLYLMGIPNNMVGMQMKPVKQKVVNLYTNVSYRSYVSQNAIRNECIKKFRLISKLESQNYRVNLFILFNTRTKNNKMRFISTIKVKGADERLNISKLAFPLVHPSMERRLLFRLLEVYPESDKDLVRDYGVAVPNSILSSVYNNGYILPEFIKKDVEQIKSLDELKYL